MKVINLLRLYKLLFLFPFFGLNTISYGQNNTLIKNQQDCISRKNEKVFVQLEKQVYIAGENLNYKAYIINQFNNTQTQKSKILYFELVNCKNISVLNWRNNVNEGKISGTIGLTDTLSCGIYTLRVFTNWMRNSSPSLIYTTNIIITKINDKDLANNLYYISDNEDTTDIVFFPEGGNLVESLENVIGYKLNEVDSALRNMIFVIKDNDGNTVTTFKADTSGYGSFALTPAVGKIYYAEYSKTTGEHKRIVLPGVRKFGYTIHSEILPNAVKINVQTNMAGYPGSNSIRLNMGVHGKIVLDTFLYLNNGAGSFVFLKNKFPEGISDIVLYDLQKNRVAERLIYLPPGQLPLLSIRVPKKNFSNGEKIRLEIETKNILGDESSELTISVTAKQPFQQIGKNQAIAPYLIFNSEIATNSAFTNLPDSLSLKKADLILLTTDAGKYSTGSETYGSISHLKESRGYILSGKVIDNVNKNPIKNGLVLLSIIDSVPALKYYYTDSLGRFFFYLDPSFDNKDLVLQMGEKYAQNENITWDIDKKYNITDKQRVTKMTYGPEIKQYLSNYRNMQLINLIYMDNLADKKNQPRSTPPFEENFYGEPDKLIFPAEYYELSDFKDIVDNLLPGIRLRKKGDLITIKAIDLTTRDYFDEQVLFLLNGVPFNNLQYILPLGSKQIKRIETVQSKVMYGNLTFCGILSVNTYDGKVPTSGKANIYRYRNEVEPKSNSEYKVTYQPNNNDKVPDLRSTLYWNPSFIIKGNNIVTIEFSAADIKSIYNINIQGVTSKGRPIGSTSFIEVK